MNKGLSVALKSSSVSRTSYTHLSLMKLIQKRWVHSMKSKIEKELISHGITLLNSCNKKEEINLSPSICS